MHERAAGFVDTMSLPPPAEITETAEMRLSEPLSDLEWDWLSGCLHARCGVRGAIYLPEQRPRIVVRYDAVSLDGADVVDLLYLCGICPESSVPLGVQ